MKELLMISEVTNLPDVFELRTTREQLERLSLGERAVVEANMRCLVDRMRLRGYRCVKAEEMIEGEMYWRFVKEAAVC